MTNHSIPVGWYLYQNDNIVVCVVRAVFVKMQPAHVDDDDDDDDDGGCSS